MASVILFRVDDGSHHPLTNQIVIRQIRERAHFGEYLKRSDEIALLKLEAFESLEFRFNLCFVCAGVPTNPCPFLN
jgi:hypothetical protein